MAQPYIGEIHMFAGNFAPVGYMFCQGQTLNISDYETLYTLIGTTYGGDGQTTFKLPDLQSRVPIHMGADAQAGTYTLGQTGGAESVTLTTNQLPVHTHPLYANNNADAAVATTGSGTLFAATTGTANVYGTGTTTALSAKAVGPNNGGSQPHANIKPYLAINFIIAVEGVFPQRS